MSEHKARTRYNSQGQVLKMIRTVDGGRIVLGCCPLLTMRVTVASLLLLLVGGCSYSDRFEMSGEVRAASNGMPLSDVKVELIEVRRLTTVTNIPTFTNSQGQFSCEAGIDEGKLLFSKPGYAPAEIDINAIVRGAHHFHYAIVLVVEMRNSSKEDGFSIEDSGRDTVNDGNAD